MRSLRMKMVMIMVILILALMLTTGAFLMSGVGNFYVSQFYEQMEGTFTPEFIAQLQRLSAEDNAPAQMKELLMAQAGLGIDITGRNVYILDQTGSVLDSSNQRTTVVMTQNILSAMNGEVGQSSSVTNDYMDLAVPVDSDGAQYIAYIRDNRATVDALTSELLIIILRALALNAIASPVGMGIDLGAEAAGQLNGVVGAAGVEDDNFIRPANGAQTIRQQVGGVFSDHHHGKPVRH